MKLNCLAEDVYITQDFGVYNPIYNEDHHNGLDYAVGFVNVGPLEWSPIDGEVMFARWDSPHNPTKGYGQRVIVRGLDPIRQNGDYIDIGFAHNGEFAYNGDPYEADGILVKEGQQVKAGTPILCRMGLTGFSSGRHTHLSARPVTANGQIIYLQGNVGGYINPLPYVLRPLQGADFMLVAMNYNNTIYVHVGTKWVGITRPEVFLELGGDWNKVVPIDKATFDRIIAPSLAQSKLQP